MSKSIRISGIAVAACVAMLVAGCGGGGGGSGDIMRHGTGTEFANLNATQAGYAANAASRAADARPRSGSITQSSNVSNGITVDRVEVTATWGAGGRHGFTVRNGSSWSISTANGSPYYFQDESAPFEGVELHRRINGGDLYVDVYSDIEAPVMRQIGGDASGTRSVATASVRLTDITFSRTTLGAAIAEPGILDGVQGTFSCASDVSFCRVSDGLGITGNWYFTPDEVSRTAKRVGNFGEGDQAFYEGTLRYGQLPGTLNGERGSFTCLGDNCTYGRSTINGVTHQALWGDGWIFIPSGSTRTVSNPDTDYLAGGVWLFVSDNATSADDVVFGAFGDGNDRFRQSNLMALQGTARYVGGATGLYADRSENEVGYWDGDVALTADFGGRSDLGSISGSVTGIESDGERYSGSLRLGAANIGSSNSGFFEGRLSGNVEGVGLSGRWGGQFFGNSEADGKPGSVGGTLGGRSDDRSASFVGVFGAYKQ